MDDPVAILKKLISIPSVSRNEAAITDFVRAWLEDQGVRPTVRGHNVYCEVGEGEKALLLNAHTDTVPPLGWKDDPYTPVAAGGRLRGLGACDTKASLAAMMHLTARLAKRKLWRGRLVFAATCMEEVGREGLEAVLPFLPPFQAAIIGEPTDLAIGIAQRGMAVVEMTTKALGGHAAYSRENPIHIAAEDIRRLRSLEFEDRHDLLGVPGFQVTAIRSDGAPNVVPSQCDYRVDIRSTPCYRNSQIIQRLREVLQGEVKVRSSRIEARETAVSESIVRTALRALPGGRLAGLAFTSEMVFVKEPGIVLGPGDPMMAHQPGESVEIQQVREATKVYGRIVDIFLD